MTSPTDPIELEHRTPRTDEPPTVREDLGELSVAELIDRVVRRPGTTTRALVSYLRERPAYEMIVPPTSDAEPSTPAAAIPASGDAAPIDRRSDDRVMLPALLGVRIFGFLLALTGCAFMAYSPTRTESSALVPGLPFLLLGTLTWIGAGIFEWRRMTPSSVEESEPEQQTAAAVPPVRRSFSALTSRAALLGIAFLASAVTFAYSGGNLFHPVGVIAWAFSVVMWVWALAPDNWTPIYPIRRWVNHLSAWVQHKGMLRITWVTAALITIVAVGAYFRLADLGGVPPEMTSDHVEKLLDSQRVADGTTQIFFQNNGGREPLQMYVMAWFTGLTGMEMRFETLKLVTALEGILSLPLMFWLGRELAGRDNRRLGLIVGLALAALVAVSYWHVALSRLALRIIYTPAITALILIYFTRALRDNRRLDWINTGLALGAGLYMYQAVRMMPVVIVTGLLIALVVGARTWIDRRRFVLNFITLVLAAFAVFLPLFRFSVDYPEDFWRRTSGRLFSDELIQTTDADGNLVEREPTVGELIAAFNRNLPVLTQNLRNALLMFHWKGDVAWINAAPNRPAFDPVSGALLMVGAGGWIVWMLRRRDPAALLIFPAILIMMLPSALAIAYPIENPSATRMSGTLPAVYLLAAFGMGVLAESLLRLRAGRASVWLAAAGGAALVLFSFNANTSTYFNDYRAAYLNASKPYSDVGTLLRLFARAEGDYGNAFMVAYPFWWDHRAIGIEAGRIDWPNGIIGRDDIPRFLRDAALHGDRYRLRVDAPLLFIYSPDDIDTELRLKLWFPDGNARTIQSYQSEDTYRVYRVPPLGVEGFSAFLVEALPEAQS